MSCALLASRSKRRPARTPRGSGTRAIACRAVSAAAGPLLEARRAPKQYRVDALLQLYRNYCTDELGLDANDATEEVAAFTKFLLEKNA